MNETTPKIHRPGRVSARAAMVSAAVSLGAILGMATAGVPGALAQDKPDVRIATARPGGSYYTMGAALAEALYKSGQVASATAEASSGSVENARLLGQGTVQLATMDANWVAKAVNGTKPFKKKIELRTVAPLYSAPIFFVALKGSGIKEFEDLKGKRIAVGVRGSGMEQHARTILKAAGWSFENDIRPLYQGFGGGAKALRAGQADAQLQCCIPNSAFTELTQFEKVQVVKFSQGLQKKIRAAGPGYGKTTITPQQVPGLDAPMPGVSILNGWITSADTDPHTVYIVVKTLLSNLDKLAKTSPQFESIKPLLEAAKTEGKSALEMGAPLHPGAERAFREAGYLK